MKSLSKDGPAGMDLAPVRDLSSTAKRYPLQLEDWDDAYRMVWSRGHHQFQRFMDLVTDTYGWPMGLPEMEWWKATPANGGTLYSPVPCGVRGSFPVTVTRETSFHFGDVWPICRWKDQAGVVFRVVRERQALRLQRRRELPLEAHFCGERAVWDFVEPDAPEIAEAMGAPEWTTALDDCPAGDYLGPCACRTCRSYLSGDSDGLEVMP